MRRLPPRSTRTDTLFPYTTLFRSASTVVDHSLSIIAGSLSMRAWPAKQAKKSCPLETNCPIAAPPPARRLSLPMKNHSLSTWSSSNWTVSGSRSEEHTSELQSLMRISYAVFCLKKKKRNLHIKVQHIQCTDENRQ